MTQKPTLDVRDLRTYFFTKGGVAKAVDGITFSIAPGKVLGLVGESGSGKTVTGFSILGLVDQPGRVVGGEILYRGEDLNKVSAERMRELRGVNISMIFQDPMMTLNPVLRIDTQMIEAIRAHEKVSKEIARQRARCTGSSWYSIPRRKTSCLSSPILWGHAPESGYCYCSFE